MGWAERSVCECARTRARGHCDPEQADALLREIRQKLLEVRDPKANSEDDAH